MISAAELAAALDGKRNGAGWRCHCPAHHDATPSLDVNEAEDGRPIFICRAGCAQRDVIAALRAKGLWQANGHDRQHQKRIVATYDYVDATGAFLFQVVRFEPKDFRQRRRANTGDTPDKVDRDGWVWSVKGIKSVPYHLDELTEAIGEDRVVLVVEGEKDVDNLREWGIPATCNAGGAGKWREDHSQWFKGADVVVIPDNDESGRAHAQDVVAKLKNIVKRVRLLRLPDLPEKGDVSDWIRAGGTSEKLYQLIDAAKKDEPPTQEQKTQISATPFVARDPAALPPRQWLYGQHYIRKYMSNTIGPSAGGKTSLTVAEALALASQKPLLGVMPTRRCRVWIWNGEDPRDEVERRVLAAMQHYRLTQADIEGYLFTDVGREVPIIIAAQTKGGTQVAQPVVDAVIAEIRQKQIDVLIVDPFVKSHRVSENDNVAIDIVAQQWATIADVTNCSIELPHHPRKTGGGEVTIEDARGASALISASRAGRTLNKMTKEEAAMAGIDEAAAWRYFRVDEGGKPSMAPPPGAADWYELVTAALANGDSVGVASPWKWPSPFDGVTVHDLRAAQEAVRRGGPWRANHQAKDWVGIPIAQVLNLDPKKDRRRIIAVLSTWIKNGMFVVIERKGPDRHPTQYVEVGEAAND